MSCSKRLAFYTLFLGTDYSWTFINTPVPSDKYDCYYYTNNKKMYDELKDTKWIRIWIDSENHADDLRNCFDSKVYKSCPHRFDELKNYSYVCWFDNKLKITNVEKIEKMMERMDTTNEVLCLTKHPYSDTYKTVWDEYNLAIQCDKYRLQKDQNKDYINRQISLGLKEELTVFYCSGVRLIKMGKLAEEMGELWYDHIKQCGIECQISFHFIEQQYHPYIIPLEYKETWTYVHE